MNPESITCPLPETVHEKVLLAHGGGGKLTHQLIEKLFLPAFKNPMLEARHDGAVVDIAGTSVAFTTDSYVVKPLFFPGGDIGSLAVHGTVNDLAMCGAKPLYLSAGFILEEGLPMETLRRVVASMAEAARQAEVQLVTGDTKVVDRGKGDGIYVNTAGIGLVRPGLTIAPSQVRPGDAVIVSGDLGRHGMAILSVREGLEFESRIESDSAPLAKMVASLLDGGVEVHALRDLTRGGLSSALVEISEAAKVGIQIEEDKVPVGEQVAAACEILGLDPLYVANEGRLVAFVPADQAEKTVELLRKDPAGSGAVQIGRVEASPEPLVLMRSRIGANRIVDMLSGEQLPRIC